MPRLDVAGRDSRDASEVTVIIGASLLIAGLLMAVIGVVDYARS